MRRGNSAFLATALLAVVGCAAETSELKTRIIADPLSKSMKPGTPMIAEAQALLALGNVGLAIEAYRIVLRAQPGSIDALAGLAECYDKMGRYDLSRTKYEMALALAPKNAAVLRKFAASLERQGKVSEGRGLRAEADAAERVEIASAEDRAFIDRPARVQVQTISLSDQLADAADVTSQRVLSVTQQKIETQGAAIQPATTTVTVKLPPPVPSQSEAPTGAVLTSSVTVKLPPPANPGSRIVAKAAKPPPTLASPSRSRPRLRRMSLGEVALVTASSPRWKTELVRRTALSTTVRFVPLNNSRVQARVRLLNAARHEGLAARTRVALNRQGWERVTIGDADRVRFRSLILYSAATAEQAKRLAAQFRFGIAKEARPGPLTILLGRDAVMSARSRS